MRRYPDHTLAGKSAEGEVTDERRERPDSAGDQSHISLNVRNIGQSVEFYKKMFGIEPSKVHAGYARFDAQNSPLNLTLNEIPFNDRGALSHMGIQVASTSDVLARGLYH